MGGGEASRGGVVEKKGVRIRWKGVFNMTEPLASCVTLDKLLSFGFFLYIQD